jgi:hypothetical protein
MERPALCPKSHVCPPREALRFCRGNPDDLDLCHAITILDPMKTLSALASNPTKAAAVTGGAVLLLYCIMTVAFTFAEQRVQRAFLTFAQPNLTEPLHRLTPDEGMLLPDQPSTLRPIRALAPRYSPIIRWTPVAQVMGSDGELEYYSHRLLYSQEYGTPSIQFGYFELACGLLAALLCAAATYLMLQPAGTGLTRFSALAVALLHIAAILWIFSYFGFFSIHSIDEYHYLDTAKKLLHPSAHFEEYPYPLGLPILYLPLLLFAPSVEPHLFAAVFAFPNAIVFGTGVILLLMALLQQAGASLRTVRIAGVLLALFPVVVSAFHGSYLDEPMFALFLGMHWILPPDVEYMSVYNATDLLGYNALSDMPALFFGLLGYILLHRALAPEKPRSLVPAACALAYALLIRLPSILLLVPAAWLVLINLHRIPIRALITAIAAAICVFAPQLLWNSIMFGNPLTFGYKFRPEDFKGFQMDLLPAGNQMIGFLHYPLLAWGVAALLLLRKSRRFQRLIVCLSLMAAAVLLFFAGYHGIGTALMRYPLPAVFALITLALILIVETPRSQRIAVVTALLTPLVLLPQFPHGFCMLPVPPWLFYLGTTIAGTLVVYSTRQPAWGLYFILLLVRLPAIMLPAFAIATAAYTIRITFQEFSKASQKTQPYSQLDPAP